MAQGLPTAPNKPTEPRVSLPGSTLSSFAAAAPPPLPPRPPSLIPPTPLTGSSGVSYGSYDIDSSYNSDLPLSALWTPSPTAALPGPPPLPPRLSLTTQFPAPAPPPAEPDALPTYHQLEQDEPGNPRFGRWRGWIEKRARERTDERDALRAAGVTGSAAGITGWDLPALDDDNRAAEAERAEDDEARRRHQRAENRLSSQRMAATNPDSLDNTAMRSPSPPSSSSLRPTGAQPLTLNSAIHPLGSRFAKQISERPRCGAVLPSGGTGQSVDGLSLERFLLVGTEEGLYLVDSLPTLGTEPLNTVATAADAIVLPVWRGLGVFRLEVFLEETPSGGAPRGVVFGLTKPFGASDAATEIKMWSLSSLLNLAKWRTLSEASSCLCIETPATSPQVKTTALPEKRSSRAFIKSLFSNEPASPVDNGKGKGRAFNPVPGPLRRSFDDSDDPSTLSSRPSSALPSTIGTPTSAHSHTRLFDPSTASSSRPPSSRSRASSGASLSPEAAAQAAAVAATAKEMTALPLEWAHSSVPLPLPKGHGPILFFELARTPERNLEEDEDERGYAKARRQEQAIIWLLVATSKVVYLFASRPGEKRTWALAKEFYAPSTPRSLTLVRTPLFPPPATTSSRNGAATAPSALPSDVSLLLGMSSKAVLIRLADSTVSELSFTASSRARSKGTSGSVSSRMSAVAKALVEGKSAIPVGVRGAEKGLAVGRKVDDDAASGAGGAIDDGSEGRWIGFEPLAIDTGGSGRKSWIRHLALVSKGATTHIVVPPLGNSSSSASPFTAATVTNTSPLPPPPIALQPIVSFTWPSPVVKVVPLLRRLPASSSSNGAGQLLILVGFTHSGISVQEGVVSTLFVEKLFTKTPAAPPGGFFIPSATLRRETSTSTTQATDEEELGPLATLDFGREIQPLCTGGPWVVPRPVRSDDDDSSSDEEEDERDVEPRGRKNDAGSYFAVRMHGDWVIKWVGSGSGRSPRREDEESARYQGRAVCEIP